MTGAEAVGMLGAEAASLGTGQLAGSTTGLLSGGISGAEAATGLGTLAPETYGALQTVAPLGGQMAPVTLAEAGVGAAFPTQTIATVNAGNTLFSLGSWGLTGKDLITLGIAGMQGVAQSRQNEKNQQAADRRRAEDWAREDQKTAERDAKTERERQESWARRMPVTGLLAPVLRRRGG